MQNPIADFMRNEIHLADEARRLRLQPRTWSEQDIRLYFARAADEIEHLERKLDLARNGLADLARRAHSHHGGSDDLRGL